MRTPSAPVPEEDAPPGPPPLGPDRVLAVLRALLARDPAALGRALPPDGDDEAWHALRDALKREGLRAALPGLLEEAHAEDRIPDWLLKDLRQTRRWCAGENRALLDRTREAARLLADAGVDAIAMKGPNLALRAYREIGAREIDDVDLLLRRPADLVVADRVLRRAGFERHALTPFGWGTARRFAHEFAYRRAGLELDLHWTPRRHFSLHFDNERLWLRRQRVEPEALDVRAEFFGLGTADELAMLLVALASDIQHGKLRLRSLLDVVMTLRALDTDLEPGVWLAERRHESSQRMVLSALALTRELLGSAATPPGAEALLERREAREEAIRTPAAEDLLPLLSGGDTSLRNRAWGLTLYQAPAWQSALWALLAVPVKATAYRRLPQALRGARRRGAPGA